MNTIQQTVTIPADRRLQLDLPDNIPVGLADMVLVISPKREKEVKTARAVLHLAGSLKNSETFRGVDPVALQKAMRDEW